MRKRRRTPQATRVTTHPVAVQRVGGPTTRTIPDRPRPPRQTFISVNALIAIAAALVAAALVMFGVFWIAANTQVAIPKVVGLAENVAEVRLAKAGLAFKVTQRPFSTLQEGLVLDQTPAEGKRARKGETVELVVSGGAEEFALPDVVGSPSTVAKSRLEQRGLQTRMVEEASDRPKGTVLSTSPQPGSPIRTGDVVLLTVARSGPADPGLKSYSLQGRMFVIDPVPLKARSGSDVTLEITRRLQALLEASGASTQSTRSVIDSNATEKVRAKRVGDLTADSVIILSAPKTGAPGRFIRIPATAEEAKLTASRRLATALSTALSDGSKPVPIASVTPGAVMGAANGPVAEVHLGNTSVQADAANFRDPGWADTTARAIYDALGKLYGK